MEKRYYIDPQGNVSQRQMAVENRQAPPSSPEPEYKYFRKPDGSVVRQQVRAAPRPGGSAPPVPHRPRPTTHHQNYGPRWTPKRIVKHLVVIGIIIMLLLWPTTIPNLQSLVDTILTGEPSIQPFPETAEFIIVRQNTLNAPANSITYEISIPEPFHIPKIHEVKGLTTTPNPTSTYEYKEQDWMKWEGAVPQGGAASLSIRYHMKLYSTLWDIDEDDSATINDIPPAYQKYLGTEWKITPDDPQVQSLSQQIVGSETDVYLILLKIYKWMDDNLEYNTQRSAEPKSCSVTLADGQGDCDDQAILLASLARAAGVPVWLNLGIIYDPVRNYWGGHGWNNVFIPLKDGSNVIATVDIVNNQFLFRDPYHVSDYLDNGNGEDLQDYYTSWSYHFVGRNPQAYSQEKYTIEDLKTSGSVVYHAP
jgi:transglutaminase-like putative cysteine protease